MENSTKNYAAISLLTLVLILSGVFVGYLLNHSNKSDVSVSDPDPTPSAAVDSADDTEIQETQAQDDGIQIPGYERLTFSSGTRAQTVSFINPEGNNCLMMITLRLPDGLEIWRSGMLRPGESVDSISLLSDVKAGTYKGCEIQYDCFDPETLETLNGAITNVDLEVK